MNNKILILVSVLLPAIMLCSCGGEKKSDNKTVLTERIQYPVFIKSPYGDEGDWWKENMEGAKREKLVNWIFEMAYSGKIKAYDYDNKPLTVSEVKAIGNRRDTVRLTRPNPPYDEYDSVIVENFDRRDVHRITFLEEWYLDEKALTFEKKVVGLCPAITMYTDSSEVKGYKPMFWLYFDDKYPVKE
ncbi:MAG: hypothetical protein WCM76_04055 [Bacteroidota bacterium]